VHVPLVMAGPGVKAGRVSDALVELIDLSATVLDLAGVEAPASFDAKSLRGLVDGRATDAEFRKLQHAQPRRWEMRFDGRYKLVTRFHEQESAGQPAQTDELYDLVSDPQERTNLASVEASRVTAMRRSGGGDPAITAAAMSG